MPFQGFKLWETTRALPSETMGKRKMLPIKARGHKPHYRPQQFCPPPFGEPNILLLGIQGRSYQGLVWQPKRPIFKSQSQYSCSKGESNNDTLPSSLLAIGGRLHSFTDQWDWTTTDRWVRSSLVGVCPGAQGHPEGPVHSGAQAHLRPEIPEDFSCHSIPASPWSHRTGS